MNAIPKFSEQVGSTFPDLTVAGEFYTQGTAVYFSLIQRDSYSESYTSSLCAVIQADEKVDSFAYGRTGNPEDEVDINYDLLEVAKYNVAVVEDMDEVLAVIGQPFFLTDRQRDDLNEMLKEHFEELRLKEIKQLEEQGEEV